MNTLIVTEKDRKYTLNTPYVKGIYFFFAFLVDLAEDAAAAPRFCPGDILLVVEGLAAPKKLSSRRCCVLPLAAFNFAIPAVQMYALREFIEIIGRQKS